MNRFCILGLLAVSYISNPAAATESWSDLGLSGVPSLVAFGKGLKGPDRYYFIPERLKSADIALQYTDKSVLSSLLKSLSRSPEGLLNVECTCNVHLRADGKWVSLPLVSNNDGTKVGVRSAASGNPVFEFPDRFAQQLRQASPASLNPRPQPQPLSPPQIGTFVVGALDESRLKAPIGAGAAAIEQNSKRAKDEEYDAAKVRFEMHVPVGYDDHVPHGLLIDVTLSSRFPTLGPQSTEFYREKKIICVGVSAPKPPYATVPNNWIIHMCQDARAYALRNYNINPERCYLQAWSMPNALRQQMVSYSSEYTGSIQIYGMAGLAFKPDGIGEMKLSASQEVFDLLKRTHPLAAIFMKSTTGEPVVATNSNTSTVYMTSYQKELIDWLQKQSYPVRAFEWASNNERSNFAAIDFLDAHPRANSVTTKETLIDSPLSTQEQREMKRLEELAATNTALARPRAVEIWTKFSSLRQHRQFRNLLDALEILPN